MGEINIFMGDNEISMRENEIFLHENKICAQMFSWAKGPCMKWCTAQRPRNFSGAKGNHARGEIFIFMHENEIFMNENKINFHAWTFSYVGLCREPCSINSTQFTKLLFPSFYHFI